MLFVLSGREGGFSFFRVINSSTWFSGRGFRCFYCVRRGRLVGWGTGRLFFFGVGMGRGIRGELDRFWGSRWFRLEILFFVSVGGGGFNFFVLIEVRGVGFVSCRVGLGVRTRG